MAHIIQSILQDANTQWVLLGTMLLGLASGILGSFALLRKQSLISDAVAHSALPGVCIAFMMIGEKNFAVLLIGAAATGLLSAYLIQMVVQTTRIKEDTSIGLVLSVFFGVGIVLLTKVGQLQTGNKSGLDSFIFGQAASLVGNDVKIMAATALVLMMVTALLFKELKVSTFDPQFAKGIGLPTGLLNFIFISLLVITVVIGIQAVGVILMAALIITPSISARYWTDNLRTMVIISGTFGAISGMCGTLISTLGEGLSTGPFIVLTAAAIFVISLLFAPKRGLLAKLFRRASIDRLLTERLILKTMYSEAGRGIAVTVVSLAETTSVQERKVSRLLKAYESGELIESREDGWILTNKGRRKAEKVMIIDELAELSDMYPAEFTAFEKDIRFVDSSEVSEEEFRRMKNQLSKLKAAYPFIKEGMLL